MLCGIEKFINGILGEMGYMYLAYDLCHYSTLNSNYLG